MKIGKKQIEWAMRGHIEIMEDPDKVFEWLGINSQAFKSMMAAMLNMRKPKKKARDKGVAYIAGFTDGFVLGVQAAYDATAIQCSKCNEWFPQPENHDEERERVRSEVTDRVKEDLGVDVEKIEVQLVPMCQPCAKEYITGIIAGQN